LFGVPKPHNEESMTKIAPTVGRVVLFTPSRLTGDGRFAHSDCRKPLAAIVSHVFSDELVNLAVFDSNDQSHSRTSVPLLQEGETMPEHGYFCSWMPYQIGQAANAAANDPNVWSGRALQVDFTELAVSGLASMYPASDWSVLYSGPSWISARVRSD
jgi:hypothetical protein